MGLISTTLVQQRGYELLLATPRNARFTASGAGAEIYNASGEGAVVVLDVDGDICRAIVETEGNEYRPAFFTTSAALTPNTGTIQDFTLPAYVGAFAFAEVKQASETTWTKAEEAPSRQDLLACRRLSTVYPAQARWAWIGDGEALITGDDLRVTYARYVRTGSCQAPDAYMMLAVAGFVAYICKAENDTSQADYYYRYLQQELAGIRARRSVTPLRAMYEAQAQGA